MNLTKVFCVLFALSLVSGATFAGSMRCGTDLIEDGQREPVLRAEVISRCGSPDSESADSLIYKQHGTVYLLRFSEGELVEITEKAQQ